MHTRARRSAFQAVAAIVLLLPTAATSQDYSMDAQQFCQQYFDQAWQPYGDIYVALSVNGTEATGIGVRTYPTNLQEHDRLNGAIWSGMVMYSASSINVGGTWRAGGPIFQCHLTYTNSGWHGHAADVLAGKSHTF